jgi:hypothetical protein
MHEYDGRCLEVKAFGKWSLREDERELSLAEKTRLTVRMVELLMSTDLGDGVSFHREESVKTDSETEPALFYGVGIAGAPSSFETTVTVAIRCLLPPGAERAARAISDNEPSRRLPHGKRNVSRGNVHRSRP